MQLIISKLQVWEFDMMDVIMTRSNVGGTQNTLSLHPEGFDKDYHNNWPRYVLTC